MVFESAGKNVSQTSHHALLMNHDTHRDSTKEQRGREEKSQETQSLGSVSSQSKDVGE